MQSNGRHVSWSQTARASAFLVSAFVASLFAPLPASAQTDQIAAGLQVWRLGGCASCHGTFGEGGGGGEQPEGPSLRRTILDRAALKETIACGRPGSKMPYFLRGAYTVTRCWGIDLQEEAPPDMTGLGSLTPPRIDALVEYLMARVVGKSDAISKQECAAYFGNPDHPTCKTMN